MAKARDICANRMVVKPVEDGIEADKREQFVVLAERFRNATDPEEVKRLALADELGRMVFG